MQHSVEMRRFRNKVLAAVVLAALAVVVASLYLRRVSSDAYEAPYGVAAPSSLKGPARDAWHLRGLGHQRLIARLDAALPATTRPTSEAFRAATRFEEVTGPAAISVKPLDETAAGDEWFVEMTVRVRDKSGAVLAEQAERLGVQAREGKWELSRIHVYGWED